MENSTLVSQKILHPVFVNCTAFIFIYFIQLYLLIKVYQDIVNSMVHQKNAIHKISFKRLLSKTSKHKVKMLVFQCISQIMQFFALKLKIPQHPETFAIQILHQSFSFAICDADRFDNSFLSSVSISTSENKVQKKIFFFRYSL